MRSIREFAAFYTHFQVTSGQMTSLLDHFPLPEMTWHHFLPRDCPVLQATACKKWNVQCTQVFGFLQPLPGNFQSNDVTSGSLLGHFWSPEVTWRRFWQCDCIRLRATAL